jgi:hypothetical protein
MAEVTEVKHFPITPAAEISSATAFSRRATVHLVEEKSVHADRGRRGGC